MRHLSLSLAVLAGVLLSGPAAVRADDAAPLLLNARERIKDDEGAFVVRERTLHWNPRQTAIVVCDMWDDHYCRSAARRVAEMAPRMNETIAKARERGVLIIHCPSGCMDFYKDTPQRKLAQQAPPVKTKVPLQRWCYLDDEHEAALPIDDSEGGCDDEKPRERKRFYTRQIKTLEIKPGDAITDNEEAYYLMQQRGIKNVLVMGVHTNMCVLGRPFSIRQMVFQGKNVALVRDLTDSMYDPRKAPYVNHFRGTELVVEHIEKYWCPTVTSADFTGRAAFRFEDDPRPLVACVAGRAYDAEKSIPAFAQSLREGFGFDCRVIVGRGKDGEYELPGLAALEDAELLVLFLRRKALKPEEMGLIRKYLESGRPLVALRTASHAFDVGDPPPGRETWARFDVEVLGCDYRGHGPGSKGTDVLVAAAAKDHPIVARLGAKTWHSEGSLYNARPLAENATVLLTGSIPGQDREAEPIAWTRNYGESRVFYTSLGHPRDFEQPEFLKLLTGGVMWAMDRPAPENGAQ